NIDSLAPALRAKFPTLSRPEGRMLHTLCAQINVSQDALVGTMANRLRKAWRCSTPKPFVPSIWCQDEPTVTQAIGLSVFRQEQVGKACKIADTDLVTLFNAVLFEKNSKLVKCNQKLACSVTELDQFNAELGWDM